MAEPDGDLDENRCVAFVEMEVELAENDSIDLDLLSHLQWAPGEEVDCAEASSVASYYQNCHSVASHFRSCHSVASDFQSLSERAA